MAYFSQKIHKQGSAHFSQKTLEAGLISPKLQKRNVKLAVCEAEKKPLSNGSRLTKILKKASNQPFFEGKKFLEMVSVLKLGPHTPPKII